jgi:hypothetical protein
MALLAYQRQRKVAAYFTHHKRLLKRLTGRWE